MIEEYPADNEVFIVDIKIDQKNNISVWVDNDKGITIDECAGISRYIEHNLDRKKEDFKLQVSSPGLDMPLKVKRQYQKNLNRMVEVITREGLKHEGKMSKVFDRGIELELSVNQKKEKKAGTSVSEVYLGFDQIKSTKVIITFK